MTPSSGFILVATVCLECGGSGLKPSPNEIRYDYEVDLEGEPCDNCAGSGWEPQEAEEVINDEA